MKELKPDTPPVEVNTEQSAPPSSLPAERTTHTGIIAMGDSQFTEEILLDASKVYNFDRLMELKNSNTEEFRNEAQRQVSGLWDGIQSFVTRSDVFIVTIQIAMGKILNEVESSFEKKGDYTSWFKKQLGYKPTRYHQQSKQLAAMGDFAEKNYAIGKNRLLEFDRLRISLNKDYEDILKEYSPTLKIPVKKEGAIPSEKIDTIITLERFKKEGIDKYITPEQANKMSSLTHGAVKVNVIKKLKARLDQEKNKKEFIDKVIKREMMIPSTETEPKLRGSRSLIKLLIGLNNFSIKVDLKDEDWLKKQKKILPKKLLMNTHVFLKNLAESLGFMPDQAPRSSFKKKEKTK